MKFIKLEKKHSGRFINRYDISYETASGKEKVYEMISRSKDLQGIEDITGHETNAVVLIMYDKDGRLLLNREFRMAVGTWVYNFPAGLVDPGETPETAAKRELWEETGLNLDEITDTLGKSYSAVGLSDESTMCVVGRASGEFRPSTSDEEEIEPRWVTKEEVREMLKTEAFAARTQAWCYLWSKE